MEIAKPDLQEASKNLCADEIAQLVEWLSLKDDNVRYQAFLLLQNRSRLCGDVYPHWDAFERKLENENSYQRSIGMMLLADNVRWDSLQRIDGTIGACLRLLGDEKPITVRQCIRSLGIIASSRPDLDEKIVSALTSVDLMALKETMRKLILLDIMNVLIEIRRRHPTDGAEVFISNALSGEILDKKSKKQLQALL